MNVYTLYMYILRHNILTDLTVTCTCDIHRFHTEMIPFSTEYFPVYNTCHF